jgi:hypothetical protein
MALMPNSAAELVKVIRDIYQDAEEAILHRLARQIAKGITSETWLDRKYADLQDLNRQLDTLLSDLERGVPGAVERAMQMAYNRGTAAAVADLEAVGRGAGALASPPVPPSIGGFVSATLAPLNSTLFRVRRWVADTYDQVTRETTAQMLTGTLTRREASAQALKRYASRGVTGFTDVSGRNWELASYAEMAARTQAAQASLQGHTDKLGDLGQDLVIVSDAPEECQLCRPWEGKVLSISGRTRGGLSDGVRVAGTVAEATLAGLYHPNAILGDHQFAAVGNIENAVRAWYEGPSIELETAGGVRFTVSPNHPVLTSRGWVPAEGLRQGDQVFRAGKIRGSLDGPVVRNELDDVESGVANKFDALRSLYPSTRVASSGDDLHGDGKFCQGEIDVVVTDDGLLPVSNTEGIQQCGHDVLSRAGVKGEGLAGNGSLDLDLLTIRASVTGALADRHTMGLEPAAEGRVADSESTSEVLAGLSCEVETDELVRVDRKWFRGHAYDFQTSFGGYLLNSILVHNCRHSQGLYIVGVTKPFGRTEDPEGDALRQRQRAYERRVREWKRRVIVDEEIHGKDSEPARATRRKLRQAQAEFKQWRDDHDRKNLAYRTSLTAR